MIKKSLSFILLTLIPVHASFGITAHTLLEFQELYKSTAMVVFSAGRCGIANDIDKKVQILTTQAPLSDYEKNQLMATYQRYRTNGYAELAKDQRNGESISGTLKGWADNLATYVCTASDEAQLKDNINKLNQSFDALIAETSALLPNLFALIEEKPQQYQIELHDLLDGDLQCPIENVVLDRQAQKLIIDFRYRGITSLTLRAASLSSQWATGSYPIDLPVLGLSNVQVDLRFNKDGSARGQWHNRVLGKKYEGAFHIIKKP
ncbi:MAG TPA: hypothetical protein DCS31_01195 [Candidatus Competibacteraceae bacterium]|nr:hypothetical protein [Candidatus Competibacteraceae bacterium]HRC69807.1 hypothetical protein [Candidatus Competibacter denitrificans]